MDVNLPSGFPSSSLLIVSRESAVAEMSLDVPLSTPPNNRPRKKGIRPIAGQGIFIPSKQFPYSAAMRPAILSCERIVHSFHLALLFRTSRGEIGGKSLDDD
jgi:hypothetical protein